MNRNQNAKKLALNTETLVRLTPDHLDHVVGGLGDIKVIARTCLWGSCKSPSPGAK